MTITNYDPRLWGSEEWTFLEIMARSLPNNLTSKQQIYVRQHLLSLEYLLPCEVCQGHYSDYVKKTNLKNMDLSKKETVKQWINNLHNLRLSKPRTMASVDEYYAKLETKYITSYTDLTIIFLVIFILLIIIKRQLIHI